MRLRRSSVRQIAAFLGLAGAVPAAHAVAVAAKPGLWERTVVLRVSETRTQVPELANKSGENLPKIDAEMRKPVYAPDLTSTSQECLKAPASISWNAMTKVDQEYAPARERRSARARARLGDRCPAMVERAQARSSSRQQPTKSMARSQW